MRILKIHYRSQFALLFLLLAALACQFPAAVTPELEVTSPPPVATRTPFPPTVTPIPSPTPLNVEVSILTEEEIIFDWETDRCADFHSADLPVRAFRNADGQIQLSLPFPVNYRMIGPDFDSLVVDCDPIMQSGWNLDPAVFDFNEWLASFYTFDGQTIYALVHNEFHGDEASAWHIHRDLSGNQGEKDWSYFYWNGSSYSPMVFDAADNSWRGSGDLCRIGPGWMHPDFGCDPALAWTSPQDGRITLTGNYGGNDPGGGDGVVASIFLNESEIWSQTIENGDDGMYFQFLEIDVIAGDVLYFRLDDRADPGWDYLAFDPQINFGPDPCPDTVFAGCNYISITSAISIDGGKTFTHPPGPDHLVATWPYPYTIARGLLAMWQPSNIVQHPTDGYFYVLVQRDDVPLEGQGLLQGMCVMRTMDLSDPDSWRAWDGEGFNMRMINPYEEPEAVAEDHLCPTVTPHIGAMSYTMTYNSYIEKFIAIADRIWSEPPGFYFTLSDDLIHWSEPQLIMPATFVQLNNWQPPYDAYPSLIDHNSPSMSFDVTGQQPFMYFARFQRSGGLGVQVIRVQLEFQK